MQLHEAIALTVGAIILIIIAAYLIINQRSKVIEWLKGAVTEAEKELGEKTGQLKLRTVYDWFIQQFPIIASIVPFPVFSGWVDIALDTMDEWLDKNKQVKSYVKGENDEGNTETES
jgi:hypothetical protein